MRLPVLASLLAVAAPSTASAYTTRLHIVLANDIRTSIMASNDGRTVTLKGNDGVYSVRLDPVDAKAITDHPEAWRAGVIGPDNFVFPAMTDLTHAIGLRPFDQCQLLYDAAILPEERAYAMGCFLHGSTDAMAHHYVNWLTGETFTLNPIDVDRADDFSNVVRHIVAESMIQSAVLDADPGALSGTELDHQIPAGFALRTYMRQDSEVWQAMSLHAKPAYDDAVLAYPPGTALWTVVGSMDVAPAEHVVLLPVYLEALDDAIVDAKVDAEGRVSELQSWVTLDGSELLVTAGSDGIYGTMDDDTDCSLSCPTLYGEYFTYVGLLMDRQDAGGRILPSAWDMISDELRDELFELMPAYMETVQRLSDMLNAPMSQDVSGLGIDANDVAWATQPMNDWVDDITTVDFTVVVQAVAPDFLLDVQWLLNQVGVNFTITDLVEALFRPLIDQVKTTIQDYAIGAVEVYLEDFIAEYEAQVQAVENEFDGKLHSASPSGVNGTMLDHFYDGGLYINSYNIAAVALAQHEMVLPDGDTWGGEGPATFDGSYTPAWTQPGVCNNLRDVVFPMGHDVRGMLSVQAGGRVRAANINEDAPIECHDGSLGAFTSSPTATNCALVDLDTVVSTKVGSVSRAFPPSTVGVNVPCRNLQIDLRMKDIDEPGDTDVPIDEDTDVPLDEDPAAKKKGGDGGGCGCASMPAPGGVWMVALLALAVTGCKRESNKNKPKDSGEEDTQVDETDTDQPETDEPVETGHTGDTGLIVPISPQKQALLDDLADTVWHSTATRFGVANRQVQIEFRADDRLWSEIVNPWGPGRYREMRAFWAEDDGRTVSSVVVTPQGWPLTRENGRADDWDIVVSGGTLSLTRGGVTEVYTPGPTPVPTSGLTATVRVFPAGGPVDEALCALPNFTGIDYATLWAFARGQGSGPVLSEDTVAGARLLTWSDSTNRWAVTDVDGFSDHGGTKLSNQANFTVHYQGTVTHSGGTLRMREQGDDVEDGVWAWLDNDVGSSNENDVFLGLNGWSLRSNLADGTQSQYFSARDVDIEVVVVRCQNEFSYDMAVDIDVGSGWQLLGNAPSTPLTSSSLFPSTF